MKNLKPQAGPVAWVIAVCLFAIDAHAQVHVGFGAGIPRDRAFNSGLFSLYGDYIRPSIKPVTWRTGIDWTYATQDGSSGSASNPSLTYTAFGVHGGVLWYPFSTKAKLGRFYTNAGPSLIHYKVSAEVFGSGGGGGITFNCAPLSGTDKLNCLLLNNLRGPSTPGSTSSSTDSAFGGHVSVGYQGTFWHLEGAYETAAAGLVKPGGIYFKFGFSSRSPRFP